MLFLIFFSRFGMSLIIFCAVWFFSRFSLQHHLWGFGKGGGFILVIAIHIFHMPAVYAQIGWPNLVWHETGIPWGTSQSNTETGQNPILHFPGALFSVFSVPPSVSIRWVFKRLTSDGSGCTRSNVHSGLRILCAMPRSQISLWQSDRLLGVCGEVEGARREESNPWYRVRVLLNFKSTWL